MPLYVTSTENRAILTVGDAADIQAALNDVSNAGGGIVYLLPGTYTLTDNLALPSFVTLEGTSRDACIIDFDADAYSVQLIGNADETHEGAAIRNLTIQNSAAPGIDTSYANDFVLFNFNVYDCSVGVRIANSEYPTFEFPFLDGNGVGMELTDCTGYLLQGASCNNSTTGAGLELLRSGDATIYNSEFNTNAGAGISIEETDGLTLFSATTRDNTGNGITVDDAEVLQISWVNIDGNGGDGIELVADVVGAQIGSNVITGNTGHGIDISAASVSNTLILGNRLATNTAGAVDNSGTSTLIRSNIGVADN